MIFSVAYYQKNCHSGTFLQMNLSAHLLHTVTTRNGFSIEFSGCTTQLLELRLHRAVACVLSCTSLCPYCGCIVHSIHPDDAYAVEI